MGIRFRLSDLIPNGIVPRYRVDETWERVTDTLYTTGGAIDAELIAQACRDSGHGARIYRLNDEVAARKGMSTYAGALSTDGWDLIVEYSHEI